MLAVLMIANGAIREIVLVRTLGRGMAEVVSAALGMTIILGTTGALFRAVPGWRRADSSRLAALWVGLTIVFEFSFGHYVDGKSWGELVENYALWKGRLWPLVLLSLAAAPFLWAREPAAR